MPNRIAAAARPGPIPGAKPRSEAVKRMIRRLECFGKRGVKWIVGLALARTTGFPWHGRVDFGETGGGFMDRASAIDAPVRRR